MQKSKIEQLIELLRSALTDADAKFSEQELEKVAIVVFDSMSNSGRNFHNINHVFDVAHGLDGISVLAAIFHDVIYYQVDGCFRPSVKQFVHEQIKIKIDAGKEANKEQFIIKMPKDEILKKLHLIFGVKTGDSLNVFSGLNEFLSASIAIAMLEPLLTHNQLLKVMGLIESTIPFRKDPITELVARFNQMHFPLEEMDDFTNRAVDFSNRDVFNFSENDPKHFLNNTWNLISETNYSLRRDADNYTVSDYRLALFKTYLFLKNLDPATVFTKYKNYPNYSNWEKLNTASKANVEIGRKYLAIQLVSIAVIEAIAELTGGNTPMSLLMGEVRRRDQKIVRMEDYLGDIFAPKSGLNKHLVRLLEEGRSQESSFDMKTSPIGTFIYKSLGEEQSETLFGLVQNYFDKKMTARILIGHYPKEVIIKIILACSKISSTRRDELIKLSEAI
ncbi:MAG: hypothetical protein PHY93_14290 [Bacteriovorax sp.]|nr:hypothetical protein [Bacteriovorax sp.]